MIKQSSKNRFQFLISVLRYIYLYDEDWVRLGLGFRGRRLGWGKAGIELCVKATRMG